MAGFTKAEDMKTRVALLGASGFQPLIIEFADSPENTERAMSAIAEMTAGKVFNSVDVEIRPSTGPAQRTS